MEIRITSVNNEPVDMEERYLERIAEEEQEQVRRDQERAERIAALSEMTMEQYIAHRMGKPKPLTNEELGKLSMDEYVKARKNTNHK